MIKVKATRLGFYANIRRREGDEFEIPSVSDMGTWMDLIDPVIKPVITESEEVMDFASKRAVADELVLRANAATAAKGNVSKASKAATAALLEEAVAAVAAADAAESLLVDEKY